MKIDFYILYIKPSQTRTCRQGRRRKFSRREGSSKKRPKISKK